MKQSDPGCFDKAPEDKLTVDELAQALYEGTPHVQNLAEKLARQHGQAGALTFYQLMGAEVQAFWQHIAQEVIDHAREWLPNDGCCCMLSEREVERLKQLPTYKPDNNEI
ncbi:MAG TPA: hypothetical protein VMX94_12025 [Armatimonadota bacterium]|nr:hypothetical protein [Armatimonadota bacterium]HUW09425.1 hypothetical protein [Anaerolineae bacterium]